MPNDIQKTQQQYTELNDFVKTLDDNEAPPTPCKLCNSKLRKEAEELYDRQKNVAAVHRWLKEKGEDISYPAVNNHINQHKNREQENTDLREFASETQKWSRLSKDSESLYNRYIDTLDREYNLLMAQAARLDLSEKRKNIELCLKISAQIDAYKVKLKELDLEKRPVEIFVDTLNRIIKVKLQDVKNPEVKRVLEDVVQQLNREVEQVPDNG
jgi:hypothetical protein